jgi:hypothetical protein
VRTLSDYSTKELHEELAKREGVTELQFGNENEIKITDKCGIVKQLEGPVCVLINID